MLRNPSNSFMHRCSRALPCYGARTLFIAALNTSSNRSIKFGGETNASSSSNAAA